MHKKSSSEVLQKIPPQVGVKGIKMGQKKGKKGKIHDDEPQKTGSNHRRNWVATGTGGR